MAMSFLAPLFDLAQDEVVKEKALEAAKQFFTNSNITINLLPALIAGALLLLLGLPLLALLFQPAADTSATGYGPPASLSSSSQRGCSRWPSRASTRSPTTSPTISSRSRPSFRDQRLRLMYKKRGRCF